MTGINILAEYTAGGQPEVALVVLGLMVIVCLIAAVGLTVGDIPGSSVAASLAAGFLVIVVSICISAEPEHTCYKVTISEDVKLIEFLDRYEILDTEGEIYMIREVNEE